MAQNSAWTVRFASVAGIPVRVHLTFLLLLALVAFEASAGGANPLPELLFIVALFSSVLAHEVGHAIVALRFGIKTRDITLYPFGGVASLLREAGPRADLVISAAGPLMNALIAMALAPWADVPTEPEQLANASFVTKLFAANVALVAFNLIPAFPMDGGRILRALLSIFGAEDATGKTVRISQGTSVVLGIIALLTLNAFLMVIAAVVFANSMQELLRSRALVASRELSAGQAMIPLDRLIVFSHGTSLPSAVNKAVRSFQPIFPVAHVGTPLGYVERDELLQAAARGDEQHYVSSLLNKEFRVVSPEDSVAKISEIFQDDGAQVVFVVRQGTFEGLILKDRLMELLLIEGLRNEADITRESDDDGVPF